MTLQEAKGDVAKALWVLNEIDGEWFYKIVIEMEDVRFWVYLKRSKLVDCKEVLDDNFSFLLSCLDISKIDRWVLAVAKRVGKNIVEGQRQKRHQSRMLWVWKKAMVETLYLPGTAEFSALLEKRPRDI